MFAKASKFVAIAILAAGGLVGAASAATAEVGVADDTGYASRPDCEFAEQGKRRRPGKPPPDENVCDGDGVQPAVWRPLPDFAAIPDRWRLVTALGYPENLWDPYNGNNVLKGDRPAFGEDWFVSLTIAFLGINRAGQSLGGIGNADKQMRADTLTPQGIRLRYVNCPITPFIDSDEQNVCEGK